MIAVVIAPIFADCPYSGRRETPFPSLLLMATSKIQETFNRMVIEHFGYLVGEYNFWVDKSLQNDPDFILEGFVEFQSPTTFVSIAGEWYGTEISLGRAVDDRKFALSVELVYEYLSLTPEQRGIVCSLDPSINMKLSCYLHPNSSSMKNANSPTAPKRRSTS